jgi:hypothetical protein
MIVIEAVYIRIGNFAAAHRHATASIAAAELASAIRRTLGPVRPAGQKRHRPM